MKRWIATFTAVSMLAFGGMQAQAAQMEKEALNVDEITALVQEEQADSEVLEQTEAGAKAGAGILVLAIIAIGIVVASS